MRSVLPMKIAKNGYVIMSAVLCILGLILMLFPGLSAKFLGLTCGIVFILFGIVKLIGYFSKDLFRLAFQFDFEFGIVMMVVGVVMCMHPMGMLNFICILLGICALLEGLFKVRIAFDARNFGIEKWWLTFVLALISAAFGLILVFRPGAGSHMLMILLGMTFLFEGILGISMVITMVKIIDHQRDERLEKEDRRF